MISLTVKTLNGRSHEFSVEDDCTVEQFKSLTEEKLAVPKHKQRLIFMGRALEDEKLLSDYGVANKVLHLVEREQPPAAASRPGANDGSRHTAGGARAPAQPSAAASGSGAAPAGAAPAAGAGPAAAGAVPVGDPFLANFLTGLISSLGAGVTGQGGDSVNVQINMDVIRTGVPPSMEGGNSDGRAPHHHHHHHHAAGSSSDPDSADRPADPLHAMIQRQQNENQRRLARECADVASHYLSQASRHLNELRELQEIRPELRTRLEELTVPPPPTAATAAAATAAAAPASAAGTDGPSASTSSGQQASSTQQAAPAFAATGSAAAGAAAAGAAAAAPPTAQLLPPQGVPDFPRSTEVSAILRQQLLPYLRALVPAVEQCADLIDNPAAQDPNAQEVLDSVLSSIHAMSHSFGSLGDLDVNVTQPAPRNATFYFLPPTDNRARAPSPTPAMSSDSTSSESEVGGTATPRGGPATSSSSAAEGSTTTASTAAPHSQSGGSGASGSAPAGARPAAPLRVNQQMFPPGFMMPMMPHVLQFGVPAQAMGAAANQPPTAGTATAAATTPTAAAGTATSQTAHTMSSSPSVSATSATSNSAPTRSSSSVPPATASGSGSGGGNTGIGGQPSGPVPFPGFPLPPLPGGAIPFGLPGQTVRVQSRAHVIPDVAGSTLINRCPHPRHASLRPAGSAAATAANAAATAAATAAGQQHGNAPHAHMHIIPGLPMFIGGAAPGPGAAHGVHGGAPAGQAGGQAPGGAHGFQRMAFTMRPDGGMEAAPPNPQHDMFVRNMMQNMGFPMPQPSDTSGTGATAGPGTAQSGQAAASGQRSASGNAQPADGLVPELVASLYQEALNPREGVTVNEVLRELSRDGQFSDDEDGGPVSLLLNTLWQHVSITDFMAILNGDMWRLSIVGPALRQTLRSDIFHDEPITESSLQVVSNDIAASWEMAIRESLVGIPGRQGVRVSETLLEEVRNVALVFFRSLNNTDPDITDYGNQLWEPVRLEIGNGLAVLCHCLAGGRDALHTVMERILRYLLSSQQYDGMNMDLAMLSPMFYQNVMHGLVDRTRATSSLSTAQLNHRMVRSSSTLHQSSPWAGAARPEAASSASSSSRATATASSSTAARGGSGTTSAGGRPAIRVTRSMARASASSGSNSALPSSSGQAEEENDDWHSSVPSDWVPVIAEDIVRQRMLPSRRPHSDSSSTSSASKRRKRSASSTVEEPLTAGVRRAIQETGCEPMSSVDDVLSNVSSDEKLQQDYQVSMQDIIRRRLESDPDYDPESHPNLRSLLQ